MSNPISASPQKTQGQQLLSLVLENNEIRGISLNGTPIFGLTKMPSKKAQEETHDLTLASIQDKGWSLRTAARHLGVHWTHLHKVIRGERPSAVLAERIRSLPHKD